MFEKSIRINAKVICDSINKEGDRVTTFELTLPRIILAELNTHRMFSRNSSSSRAIPFKRMIEQVNNNPFIPLTFPAHHKGMSTGKLMKDYAAGVKKWLKARDVAVESAIELHELGVSKQLTNRLLEAFMWQTVVLTTTNTANFFHQRISPSAEQHINELAILMKRALDQSSPVLNGFKGWHLPYITIEELTVYSSERVALMSVGRCARVSFLDRKPRTAGQDYELGMKIIELGHFSPTEHQACIDDQGMMEGEGGDMYKGNLKGWLQFRKNILGECKE